MKRKNTLLVIDDEPPILQVMEANLRREGYEVHTAKDAQIGLEKIKSDVYDTIIVDYLMPGLTGLELLNRLREMGSDIPVIVVTAHGSIEHAVQAMKMGASNYLTKPLNYDELLTVVKKAVEEQNLRNEVKRLRQEVTLRYGFDQIVGQNEKIRAIFDLIAEVAETDATVLIKGETGTGKELIARALHFNSSRKNRPFVRVNSAALTESLLESELFGHEKGAFTGAFKKHIGRFEQADGGTIFLDEVGDIPLSTQAKLLRVLQEKEFVRVGGDAIIQVDVRIISATHSDLEKAVREGKFREDLFYRLHVIPIEIPPLRDRIDDVPLLAFHFMKIYAERFRKNIRDISNDALHSLMSYHWPGNVRELENIIERAVILEKKEQISNQTISMCLTRREKSGYQYFINENLPLKELKEELVNKFEREYVSRLLKRHKGNISEAAKSAGMHYKNFCEKMKKFNLTKWDFKGG